MFLFYIPNIETDIVTFSEEESRHCLKVLRLRKGDSVNITDGKGFIYEGNLIDENNRGCSIEIIRKEIKEAKTVKLHIAIAPTKNISRFEWFLEKATEIGIDEITPIICEHSERKSINTDRSNRILISALKQSNILYLPILHPAINYKDFILKCQPLVPGSQFNKFIAVCDNSITKPLKEVYQTGSNAVILIGPEGDFSKDEINSAIDSGFIPVSLSPNRLRTETAALIACTTINVL